MKNQRKKLTETRVFKGNLPRLIIATTGLQGAAGEVDEGEVQDKDEVKALGKITEETK